MGMVVRSRIHLLRVLGGKCDDCGLEMKEGDDTRDFQVDHKDGRDWDLRQFSYRSRVKKYWREFDAGVRLGVLCGECSGWDGHMRGRPGYMEAKARRQREKRRAEEAKS